jgi:hypothetical protein
MANCFTIKLHVSVGSKTGVRPAWAVFPFHPDSGHSVDGGNTDPVSTGRR